MTALFAKLAFYWSYPFVRCALAAGVLIALCSSLLGVTLVLRRLSFIGDGLSHVAFGSMSVAAVAGLADRMPLTLALTMVCAVLLLALALPLAGCQSETTPEGPRFTEDGGAPPYDYTAADQAADDLPGEAADWELLDMDDFLPQPKPPQPQFRTIQSKTKRRSAYESHVSEKQKPAE